ncbi:MAG: aminopeptidase P family N-terminal domain-containing protein, partial [Alphaproteobacteria bacterium]|nr:aminopeptidase P family N-terminal domain-containing protein [Alphaproteobacteria bacterium]
LAHITGFKGSAGAAVVLKDKAAFFTDNRYTLQVRNQVDSHDFEIYSTSKDQLPTPTLKPTKWIEKNLHKNAALGIDPWLHTVNGVKRIRNAIEKAGGALVFVNSNPLDATWKDRPPTPATPIVPYPLEFAGKS